MKLIELDVKNFYGLDKFHHEYLPGVTGFLGHVGSGKSSFGEYAQYFAVAGCVPTGVGKKEDLITWGKHDGFTNMTFEHDGIEYSVKRNLHNSAVKLTWEEEGIKKELKQKEANDLVLRMLGMSPEIFYECCFVRQGGLWDILLMTHADRMKYFQRITGTIKAEKLRKLLQDASSRLPTYPDRSTEIAECRATIAQHTHTRDALQAEIDKLELVLKRFDKTLEEIIATLGGATSETQWRENAAKAEAEKDRCSQAVKALEKRIKDECGEMPPKLEPITAEEGAERRGYENWMIRKYDADESTELLKTLGPALAKLLADEVAAKSKWTAASEKLNAVREAESKVQARIDELNAKLKLAEAGVCPTCSTKITTDPEAIRKELSERTAIIEDFVKNKRPPLLKAVTDSLSALESLASARQDKQAAVTVAQKRADISDQKSYESYDPKPYDARLEAKRVYDEWRDKRDRFNSPMESARTAINRAELALETAKAAPYLTDAEIADLEAERDKQGTIRNAINKYNQSKAEAAATITSQTKLKHSYESDMAKQADIIEYRERIETARKYLHRDVLPKIVMGHLRASLAYEVHNLLRTFDMPFTVELNSEFDYVVHWGQYRDRPISSLSGGQKIVVSICHHLALANILAGSLPMIFIDEPTNHLGAEEKDLVREVLFTLKQKAGQSTPVMVATHEPALHAAFARTVQFSRKD